MTEVVDRRKFLKYSGAAGAATGALWVAPSVLGSSSALATGSVARCDDPQRLHWADMTHAGHYGAFEPDTDGSVSTTVVVAANGSNPAVDVKMTIVPIGHPQEGNYQQYDGTGGVNFMGNNYHANNTIFTSYFAIYMLNSHTNWGYTMQFQFFEHGTTTPITVYNLAFTFQGLTLADPGRFGNDGYVDTVSIDQPYGFSQGNSVTGSGTALSPWKATTDSDTNSNINISDTSTTGTTGFTFTYTNTTWSDVSEWIWLTDLTWC